MVEHYLSSPALRRGQGVHHTGARTVKQWRGLATRYDKLAVVYRAAAVLSTIVAWLAPLGDTS